jgi:hypothetical protein
VDIKKSLTKDGKKFWQVLSIEYDKLYAGYRRQLPHPDRMEIEVAVLFSDLEHLKAVELPTLFQNVRLTVNRWPSTADILDAYDKMKQEERTRISKDENYQLAEKIRLFEKEEKEKENEDRKCA